MYYLLSMLYIMQHVGGVIGLDVAIGVQCALTSIGLAYLAYLALNVCGERNPIHLIHLIHLIHSDVAQSDLL